MAVQPDICAHRHGFDENVTAEEARSSAIQHAIAVMGVHGATWPAYDEGFCRIICRRLLDELVIFSIHARRFLEVEGARDVEVEGSLWRFQEGVTQFNYEKDLWTALNRILHARYLQAMMLDMNTKKYEHLGDRIIVCAEAQSDRGEMTYICPTAVATTVFSIEPNSSAKAAG